MKGHIRDTRRQIASGISDSRDRKQVRHQWQLEQTGAPSVAIGVAITSGSEASDHDQHASTQTNHAIRPIRSASVAIRFVNLPVDVVAPNSAPSSVAPTPLVPCHVALGTALLSARALSSPSNGACNQHAMSMQSAAMSDTQMHSDALGCSQIHSDSLRFTQIHSLRFTQIHSDALRCHQPTGSLPSIGTLREAASSGSYWPRVPDEGGNHAALSRNPYAIDTQLAWRGR